MKYIVNNPHNPAYNVALEAYAFCELLTEDEPFILWINEPTIVIGKRQSAIEEISKAYTDEHGTHVVRRLSGGGVVYHNLNNLNYTIISNKSQEGVFDFKTFSQPATETLADLGVIATFMGRNDLEVDGKKFCGNAQAYYKGQMMYHGCLLFDVDMTVLGNALQVLKDKIKSKGVKSVRAHVTNISDELPEKMTVETFSSQLLNKMKESYPGTTEYVFSDNELKNIQALADQRFGTWGWTYGEAPEYTIKRSVCYPAGKITIYVNVEKSVIKGMKLYGDFPDIKDVTDTEQALIGSHYEYSDVLAKPQTIDITQYFANITPQEITKIIVG